VRDARFQTNPAIILPSFYFTNWVQTLLNAGRTAWSIFVET
jgi:hypothetical protein